jgi:hypothetical protein
VSRRLVLLPAVAAAVVAGGCVRVSRLSYPAPPPTPPPAVPTTITTLPDLTGVSLAAVSGPTTTAVALGPGGATLTGTVVGPAGPVGGADVHVERLVGDTAAAVDVTAKPDGTWTLPGVLGGRYRVRAWRSPDLAQTAPQIFFLAATQTWSATLQLEQFDRAVVTAVVDPNPPVVGQPSALTVQLTTQMVDATGIVRARPVPNATVSLSLGGSWTLSSPDSLVTAADGVATWQLVCGGAGPQLLAATVNDTDAYPVDVPPCIAPPPPPTTSTSAATTSTSAPTATTSAPTSAVTASTAPATSTTLGR